MVFEAGEALVRFGSSHATVVVTQELGVPHHTMFNSLEQALAFISKNTDAGGQCELHVHRGGHDVLIVEDELEQLVAFYQDRPA